MKAIPKKEDYFPLGSIIGRYEEATEKWMDDAEQQIKHLKALLWEADNRYEELVEEDTKIIKKLEDKLSHNRNLRKISMERRLKAEKQIKKLEEVIDKWNWADRDSARQQKIKELEELEQLVELIIDENWIDGADICKVLKDQQEGKNKGI